MRGYLEGVSLAAFARGNRRILAPLKAKHAEASADHAAALADLRARRTKARQLKDPAERAKALEELKGESPIHPTLIAAGCTAVAAVVGWPMLHSHAGALVAGGLTLWVIVAMIAGQQPADPATEEDIDTDVEVEEEPEGALDQTPAVTAPTPAAARRAVAVLGAAGTHVALTAVTAHLAAEHPLWKRSGKAVRALLREAGVEVRGGVRVEGVSVPGIHHDDVPPLPSPAESAPGRVVVAGQSNNNDDNNAEEWVGEKGFIMRAHPDHPDRTIIVGRTSAA